MEYYSAFNNAAICNMGGPWEHYVKGNKSDREKQIMYDLIYMWNLRKLQFLGKE